MYMASVSARRWWVEHITLFDKELHEYGKGWMKIYIPARSAVVLRHSETK